MITWTYYPKLAMCLLNVICNAWILQIRWFISLLIILQFIFFCTWTIFCEMAQSYKRSQRFLISSPNDFPVSPFSTLTRSMQSTNLPSPAWFGKCIWGTHTTSTVVRLTMISNACISLTATYTPCSRYHCGSQAELLCYTLICWKISASYELNFWTRKLLKDRRGQPKFIYPL